MSSNILPSPAYGVLSPNLYGTQGYDQQDKSSDIDQQLPFFFLSTKIKQYTASKEGEGVQNQREHHKIWQSMKRCTRRSFQKIIPHQEC